jgi:protease PrsW
VILGGVLFGAAAGGGRLRLTGSLVGFYLLVAALHGLWDATQPIAVWLMLVLTASPVQWQLLRVGQIPSLTQGQVHLFTALYWALLALTAVIGLLVLRSRWHQATGRDQPSTAAPAGTEVHRR